MFKYQPIWRDIYWTTTADTVEYRIKKDDTVVYQNRARKMPGDTHTRIHFNKICKDYLDSDIADYMSGAFNLPPATELYEELSYVTCETPDSGILNLDYQPMIYERYGAGGIVVDANSTKIVLKAIATSYATDFSTDFWLGETGTTRFCCVSETWGAFSFKTPRDLDYWQWISFNTKDTGFKLGEYFVAEMGNNYIKNRVNGVRFDDQVVYHGPMPETTLKVHLGHLKVYEIEIWEVGEKVAALKPKKRKSDGACGLYDSVRDMFITENWVVGEYLDDGNLKLAPTSALAYFTLEIYDPENDEWDNQSIWASDIAEENGAVNYVLFHGVPFINDWTYEDKDYYAAEPGKLTEASKSEPINGHATPGMWLLLSATSYSGGTEYTYEVTKNVYGDIRFKPNELTFGYEGGEARVIVHSNIPWTAASSELEFFPTSGEKGATNLYLVCPVATGTTEKDYTITFYGEDANGQYTKTFNVYQNRVLPQLSVEWVSGGTYVEVPYNWKLRGPEFFVDSNLPWTATTDNEWLRLERDNTFTVTGGTGVTTVMALPRTNDLDTVRVGTITVRNRDLSSQLTVAQNRYPHISVTPNSLSFNYRGGTADLVVSANYPWTAYIYSNPWVTLNRYSGNAGETVVTVTAEEYDNYSSPRSANIYFHMLNDSVPVSVVQTYNPDYIITPTTLYFGGSGGTQTFTVSANTGYTIVAPSYFTVSPLAGGSGRTVFTVTAPPNEGDEIITERIIIGDDEIIVTQGIFGLLYTSTNGQPVTPYNSTGWTGQIVSNTYNNGIGVIRFSNDVSSIPERAFAFCTTLRSIVIPDNYSFIGTSAFYYCTNLETVTLSSGVTTLENSTFEFCEKLSSIDISNVTYIGGACFNECKSITGVTLSPNLYRLDAAAFGGCQSLESIVIPSGVTSIANSVFSDCTALSSVTFQGNINGIGRYSFAGCTSLSAITLPSNMGVVDQGAFDSCSALTEINCYSQIAPLVYDYTFHNVKSGGVLHLRDLYNIENDYNNTWMKSTAYFLGYYGWTITKDLWSTATGI